VGTLTHGLEGLELARRERPDLVLLDLGLPGLGGEELLRRLRADPATAPIPAIVVSADASPERIARLLKLGADAYLTTPIDTARAMGAIADALEGARS